ncbi:MAG: metal ABC transporter permease [Cytophagales bacterium]|nr:metal ABC transporter permease [Cytophagales bacterium]
MDALLIILVGTLAAASCGLLGSFLVLRRMAMVGDAISHAVLPGIVLAYLASGSRDSLLMSLGAIILGLFTTFLIEFLTEKGRLQSDASIGVTFTWLFAVGVILISVFAGQVDLDQDCVLYGEIAYVPIDLWILPSGQIMGPRALYILGVVLAAVVLLVIICYKELMITTFDPGYAQSIGMNTRLWNYVLMGAVSVTTVASFESVGAILVVALLVAPPATAYLLTDKFKTMLWLSVLLGLLASAGGYVLAVAFNGSIAGAIATVAGFLFGLALVFSPLNGLAWKGRKKSRLAQA